MGREEGSLWGVQTKKTLPLFDLRPYVLDIESHLARPLTLDIRLDSMGPASWSHDGRWIYFSADEGTKGRQVWKVPVEGGRPRQITRKGGHNPRESADGEFVYYDDGDRPPSGTACTIWRVHVTGGEEVAVTEDQEIPCQSWALWGNSLVYGILDGSTAHLHRLDLETRQVTRFSSFELPGGDYSTSLTVSPDGSWVVVSLKPPASSDLMLVEDFS